MDGSAYRRNLAERHLAQRDTVEILGLRAPPSAPVKYFLLDRNLSWMPYNASRRLEFKILLNA